MTYQIAFSKDFEKTIEKLKRHDPFLFEKVSKKMLQIAGQPNHYKPLGNMLKGCRRVHLGSFVLVYEINEAAHEVIFLKFEHHDNAY